MLAKLYNPSEQVACHRENGDLLDSVTAHQGNCSEVCCVHLSEGWHLSFTSVVSVLLFYDTRRTCLHKNTLRGRPRMLSLKIPHQEAQEVDTTAHR